MDRDAPSLWKRLKPNSDGHVAAVVQHDLDGRVLMVGYMNAEALEAQAEQLHALEAALHTLTAVQLPALQRQICGFARSPYAEDADLKRNPCRLT